jgi:uncharacterized protein YkwD
MKSSTLSIFFALVVSATQHSALRAQPTEIYSHGNPTNLEQHMLEMINRARANPMEEGVRLMDTDDQAVQQAYSFFSINKSATKAAFAQYPMRPPLAFHPLLIQASRNHTSDMVAMNFQGHTSSNGQQLDDRYATVGYTSQGMFGENVAAYSNSVWYGHCGLNVDWGEQNQIELGHRKNIMNFESTPYTEIGIGITNSGGGLQQGTVGPLVITQNFGIRQTRYVTGVVYRDLNDNGMYDPGEGIAGVSVTPNTGSHYAITSESGGYAFPVAKNTTISVTFAGEGIGAPSTVTASVGTDNYKLDFVPAASAPLAPILQLPANNATNVVASNVTLTWRTVPTASMYAFQVAKDQQFSVASIVIQGDSPTPEVTIGTLPCGTKLYWRTRASNAQGDGPWSAPFNFTTGGRTPSLPIGLTSVDSLDRCCAPVRFTMSWQAVPEALTYHVRVSRATPPFGILWQDSTVQGLSAESDFTSDLAVEVVWSVRAKNACGYSGWGTDQAVFVSGTTSVADQPQTGFQPSVYVYPNPASSELHVVLEQISAANTPHVIALHDAQGKQIVHVQSMQNNVTLPLIGVASGAYTIVVTTPTGKFATPVVVR